MWKTSRISKKKKIVGTYCNWEGVVGKYPKFSQNDGPWNLLNCSETWILVTQEVRRINSSKGKLQHHSWATIYTLISIRHILSQAQWKGMSSKPQKIIQKKLLWTCPLVLNCTNRLPYYNVARTTGKRTGWYKTWNATSATERQKQQYTRKISKRNKVRKRKRNKQARKKERNKPRSNTTTEHDQRQYILLQTHAYEATQAVVLCE
jgi:hypothetical protein